MTFRRALHATAIAVAAFASTSVLADGKEVRVFNWADYVDPEVLKEFTKETGIKVIYDVFSTSEILQTKLLTGKSGYDIVVPTGSFVSSLITAGALQPLDKSRLKNLEGLDAEISKKLESVDPGNKYVVNYMWGTTGIAVNAGKVKTALGDNVALDTWDIFFKPENINKLKSCGVQILDDSEQFLAVALHYKGLPPTPQNADVLQQIKDLLDIVRPNVKKINSDGYVADLRSGDLCLVFGYSGQSLQARNEAAGDGKGIEIKYIIPKEGSPVFFDNLAIPADAPNLDNAYAFLNFIMRPDIAARNTNFVSYANGVAASKPHIKPEIATDTSIYPDAELMSKLYFVSAPRDQQVQRAMTRLWTNFQTGQ